VLLGTLSSRAKFVANSSGVQSVYGREVK
jgi:hypothetical protein